MKPSTGGKDPKVEAYCKACDKMIDITTTPFIDYVDEAPMVLDIQLKQPYFHNTSEAALDFIRKHHPDYDPTDYDTEEAYHYENAKVTHMEAGDKTHNLEITGGYWSTL